MKSFVAVFVAVLMLSAVTMSAVNTGNKVGVKAVVSQNGLTYLKDYAIPLAEAAALAAVIPDMTETAHIALVGDVDLTLKNIKINRLSVASSSIVLNSGNIIAVSITGLNTDITLDWHYRQHAWPHIADSGSGEGSTTSAAGTVELLVGSDSTGHPTAQFATCGLDMSTLQIKLHGGSSWLYDAVISLFHKKIVKSIESGVCSALTTNVQAQLSQYLASLPVQHNLGKYFALDYSLAYPSGIAITPDGYLLGSCAGEFFPVGGQPGQAPGQPVKMPDNVASTQFQVFLSDYSVESLGYTAVKMGFAQMLVTKDMVPPLAQDFFTTGFYSQYAAGLLDKYGADAEISLFIDLQQTPDVIFSETEGIDVKAGVDMTLRAKNKAGTFEDAFTLLLSCVVDGEAEVNSTAIYGSLSNLEVNASLVQSQVGEVDVKGFNDLIKLAISMFLGVINDALAKGAPLPALPGMEFVKPVVTYKNDYIVVATGIHFDP